MSARCTEHVQHERGRSHYAATEGQREHATGARGAEYYYVSILQYVVRSTMVLYYVLYSTSSIRPRLSIRRPGRYSIRGTSIWTEG